MSRCERETSEQIKETVYCIVLPAYQGVDKLVVHIIPIKLPPFSLHGLHFRHHFSSKDNSFQ
jgi:hypothetical protein